MSLEAKAAFFIAFVLFVLWFFSWVKDKYFRRRGVWIERKSIKALQLPKDWSISPDVRYAVEIKSAESAKKVWFSLFTKDEIRKANGDRFPRDHVAQTRNVALRLNAVPVLWFPKAKHSRRFKTRSGVIVVLGGHKVLERAIGARWGWLWL